MSEIRIYKIVTTVLFLGMLAFTLVGIPYLGKIDKKSDLAIHADQVFAGGFTAAMFWVLLFLLDIPG